MTKNYTYVTRIFYKNSIILTIVMLTHTSSRSSAHLVATLGEGDLTRQVHYFLHLGRINVKLVV
jgi:hypothetical protein